jgi:hypothetical protein
MKYDAVDGSGATFEETHLFISCRVLPSLIPHLTGSRSISCLHVRIDVSPYTALVSSRAVEEAIEQQINNY